MSNEIAICWDRTKVLYGTIRDSNRFIYDPVDLALETLGTWNDARITACALYLTLSGDVFYADFPTPLVALGDGDYLYQIRERGGATPSIDDPVIYQTRFFWRGSREIDFYSIDGRLVILNANIAVVDQNVDDIETKTTTIDTKVDAIKAETALIVEDTGTTIPAQITEINTLIALATTIASVITTDTIFTLTDGSADDGAYDNMVMSIDHDGDIRERRIIDYIGATKQVTVDADYEFAVVGGGTDVGDVARIYLGAYSTATTSAQVNTIAVACADAVLDEDLTSHQIINTPGSKLRNIRGLER